METPQIYSHDRPNYLDPFSVMIVNQKGVLCRLHCPFIVICSYNSEGFLAGKYYRVDMVKLEPAELLYYVISGKNYPHSWFSICLKE
ncbi:hypothetical protein [Runella rosea]|uniref:hypothetical protein n=1 Tax=Runella rosea TaxID=2259595 RepID=UPI0013B451E2|nr:hypothetical protein [Runella rosea]